MLKKIIITNVLSQYISQFGLLSIQLFIFAYLSKVLSIENFGKLSFLLTINSIFFIIADFGFSWSTSRKISSIKDNKILSSEVFMTAWASQILITVIIFIINIIAMNLFNIADIPNNILVYSLGIFIGQILFPTWLLNCIDKINVILMIQFVSKILPAPLLFYYANNENDLYSSIIFLSVTNIFSGILFILYALIYMQIYWKLPKINEIINTLLEGKNSINGHKGNSSIGCKSYGNKKKSYEESNSKVTRDIAEKYETFEEKNIIERSKFIVSELNKYTNY